MSKIPWIVTTTLGLILFSQMCTAQEGADQRNGTIAATQTANQSTPFSVPVKIIEEKAASDVREKLDAEARQREIDDLVAQQQINIATQAMNDATQKMALYSFWSTVLVAIGTVALAITLYFTRQANSAAQAALEITRDIGEKQTRAYVSVDTIKTEFHAGLGGLLSAITFSPIISNYGASPAFVKRVAHEIRVIPERKPMKLILPTDTDQHITLSSGAKDTKISPKTVPIDIVLQCQAGVAFLISVTYVEYRDVFFVKTGITHTETHAVQVEFSSAYDAAAFNHSSSIPSDFISFTHGADVEVILPSHPSYPEYFTGAEQAGLVAAEPKPAES